jgi:NDP-sugar pyrophosphorylase family protein
MKPTLLIMAAGMGSRYGGLKQIDPVGPSGEAIIEYSVYDAIQAGFGKVVFIIRKDIEEAFRESVGKKFEGKIDIDYAFQELDDIPAGFSIPEGRTKPWGTGHAILVAKNVINEPFAVINADDFYGLAGFKLQEKFLEEAHNGESIIYSMVGYVLRNTLSPHGSVSRGICQVNGDNILVNITELTKIEKDGDGARYTDDDGKVHQMTGDELASMNLWGFTPSIFKYLEVGFTDFLKEHGNEMKSEFFIVDVIDEMMEKEIAKLKVLPCHEPWFGVTYPEDKPAVVESVRKLVDDDKYPQKLWG